MASRCNVNDLTWRRVKASSVMLLICETAIFLQMDFQTGTNTHTSTV